MEKFMNGCLDDTYNLIKEDYDDMLKSTGIKDPKRDKGCIYALIFCWQQQATTFNKTIDPYRKQIFMDAMIPNVNNKLFYRGIHISKDRGGMELYDINKFDFVSTTTNVDVAIDFAYGYKNSFKDKSNCYVALLTSDKMIDVNYYFDDLEEDEYILYKPKLLGYIKLNEENERLARQLDIESLLTKIKENKIIG